MPILIDSMIWIYFFDTNSNENPNVSKWIKETLRSESILLPTIIPLEVGHNLYRVPNISKDAIESLLLTWISQKNLVLFEVNELVMMQGLQNLKNLRQQGIGGRDCIILSSMALNNIDTIISHDKNILRLEILHRIDPVFDPPLNLKIGDTFNSNMFKNRVKSP